MQPSTSSALKRPHQSSSLACPGGLFFGTMSIDNTHSTIKSGRHYEATERIGRGSFGEVYKARNKETGSIVAMKKILKTISDGISEDGKLMEAEILKKFDDRNIVKLQGAIFGRNSDGRSHWFLIFEHCDRDLMSIVLDRSVEISGSHVKSLAHGLLLGVKAIHQKNIIHRDLKPSNVFITKDGVLKIGDFGLACHASSKLETNVVTLPYRAPEILLQSRCYDSKSDMWSVGCILGELFLKGSLLRGKDVNDQLLKIEELCGNISLKVWPKCHLLPGWVNHCFLVQKQQERSFRTRFEPHMLNQALFDTYGIALVENLLSLDPAQRPTARGALNDEWFKVRPVAQDNIRELLNLLKKPSPSDLTAQRRREK